MKHRILIMLITLLTVACGAVPTSEPTEEQSQAATTNYTATNNTRNTTTTAGKFCRLTSFSNRGGHLSSPQWPTGDWKNGALIVSTDGSPNAVGTIRANPFGGPAQPPTRTSTATTTCSAYADYGFGSAASQSSPSEGLNLQWGYSAGSSYVSGDRDLGWLAPWTFCYLNGFQGISGDEGAAMQVYQAPGGTWEWPTTWRLQGQGVPNLIGFAKCVYPHRSFTIVGPFRATNSFQTAAGPPVSNTFCALTMLAGNLDDATVSIYQDDGDWKLNAHSHASDEQPAGLIAEMTCAVF